MRSTLRPLPGRGQGAGGLRLIGGSLGLGLLNYEKASLPTGTRRRVRPAARTQALALPCAELVATHRGGGSTQRPASGPPAGLCEVGGNQWAFCPAGLAARSSPIHLHEAALPTLQRPRMSTRSGGLSLTDTETPQWTAGPWAWRAWQLDPSYHPGRVGDTLPSEHTGRAEEGRRGQRTHLPGRLFSARSRLSNTQAGRGCQQWGVWTAGEERRRPLRLPPRVSSLGHVAPFPGVSNAPK